MAPKNQEIVLVVFTDPTTGLGQFGTCVVEAGYFDDKVTELESIRKDASVMSDPHHPNHPLRGELVEIKEGSLTIFVANDGRVELNEELHQGDKVLFLDFKKTTDNSDNLRFGYSGHCSRSGVGGVTLKRFKAICYIDFPELNFQEGTARLRSQHLA